MGYRMKNISLRLSLLCLLFGVSPLAWSASIVDGVYQPKRMQDGKIDTADFASLPENVWLRVAGSSFGVLQDEIVRAFNAEYKTNYPWNKISVCPSGNIANSINGWTGGLWDEKRQRVVLITPGGHTNGCVTGIWAWNVLTAAWGVVEPPANPYDADTPWSAKYRKSHSTTYYPRGDMPADIAASHFTTDILPDGTPTARHQYRGEAHDPINDIYYTTRHSLWAYDLESGKYRVNALKIDGKPFVSAAQGAVVFNQYHNELVGLVMASGTDYYGWRTVDVATGNTAKIGSLIGTNFAARGGSLELIPGTTEMLIMAASEDAKCERYSVYNLKGKRGVVGSETVNGCLSYTGSNELPALTYVPEWGQWLRRMTTLIGGERCGWYLFDHVNNVQRKVEFENPPACAPYIGRKLVYSQPLGALVLISETNAGRPAVHMLRVGTNLPTTVEVPEPPRTDLQAQIDKRGTVTVGPGRYAGTLKINNSVDADFAAAELTGRTSNGMIEPINGSVTLRNMTVTQSGRAAIWAHNQPRLRIINPVIENQSFGMVTPSKGAGEVYVEGGVLTDNAAYCSGGFGKCHPIYFGQLDWAELDGTQIHNAGNGGHLYKSRAAVNIIENATIDGGKSRHSRIIDVSCGGFVRIANSELTQSPNADNNDLIAVGAESGHAVNCSRNRFTESTLVLENVTITAARPSAVLLHPDRVAAHPVRVVCVGKNKFIGFPAPACDTDTAYSVPENPWDSYIDPTTIPVVPLEAGEVIDFGARRITGYPNQDLTQRGGPAGQSITLDGNTWKRVSIDYEITENSVLEFRVDIQNTGEIVAIGFDMDGEIAVVGNRTARLGGSQSEPLFIDVPVPSNGVVVLRLAGIVAPGRYDNLLLIADDDASANAKVTFSNVSITETTEPAAGPDRL